MDMKAVIINYAISNSLCTVFVVLFWYQNRSRFAGLDFWLAGFTMQITGIALLVFRSIAPDFISNEFFRSSSFDTLIILLHQTLFIVGTFGLFLMVNQRLVADLERDVMERKQKETSLHQVQAQIIGQQRVLATFEERERMARDLHDGIGQTLGYVNVQAQAVCDLLTKNEKESAMQLLERLVEVTQEAHSDVRGYILGLKSDTITLRQDFLTALVQYCEHLRQTYEFQVALLIPEDLPTVLATTAVETQLIYIIREALSNAQRHSDVSHASVTITFDDANVHFIVQDMGIGFVTEYAGPERRKVAHFGLEMMRERAEQVGGSLQIETAPGVGMKISGWLPRKLPSEDLLSARILLVDDHPLFLDGLRNLLTVCGMQVIGTANDGFEALEAARRMKPDIIAMDIQMPRCNGLEATRLIKAEMPNVKIVMLTTSVDEENLFEALQNGASGYLLKSMSIDEFSELLSGLIRGESVFSAGLANKTLEVFSRHAAGRQLVDLKESTDSVMELTERQLDVLRLVSQGLMYKEIGSRLFLTERTVKYHIGEILGRLHLKTRREAIDYARDKGLV